jgi:hypothetical protein
VYLWDGTFKKIPQRVKKIQEKINKYKRRKKIALSWNERQNEDLKVAGSDAHSN